MTNLPPPRNDLPDYYLGCLIYYDTDPGNNCRWVVYDGHNRVRCATRRDACDYINSLHHGADCECRRLLIAGRIDLNSAIDKIDRAALMSEPTTRLLLQRHAVRLRPLLVDLDNIILPTIQHG